MTADQDREPSSNPCQLPTSASQLPGEDECRRCGRSLDIPPGKELTIYCHECAHDIAEASTELLTWAYGKLHYRSFDSMEDALKLDEIKLILMGANDLSGNPG